jgi:hypothetical protein
MNGTIASTLETTADSRPSNREAHSSGVSWGAVIGGAFVAAALYLILLALGAGFELSAISPWANVGLSASAAGTAAIVWLIFIEIAASSLGGYLTGRLRTKWALVHTDEVFFRDTANGFLSWAVGLVVSVTLLASAATSMAGGIAQSAPQTESNASAAATLGPQAYFVDALFRSDRPESADPSVRAEAGRILANALRRKDMPAADQTYLSRLVAAKAGLTPAEADSRVSNVLSQAREKEDAARKATAHFLLWLFLSLLIGAFCASYAATIGGRQRDHARTVEA